MNPSPEEELKYNATETDYALRSAVANLTYAYRHVFNMTQLMPNDRLKRAFNELAKVRATIEHVASETKTVMENITSEANVS